MDRPRLLPVYATVFLDLLGFGIILPQLPYYAERFGASGFLVGVLLTAYSGAQFLAAPLLGRLSDRVGRRPVLLASLVGSAASFALCGLASNLTQLVAARALAGMFGGSIGTAQAYVADVTAPAERAGYMGRLGGAIGLGFVFGPVVGAGMARFGFSAAAFTAAGLALANLVLAAARLPEPVRRGGGSTARGTRSLAALLATLSRPASRRLLAAMFLGTFAFVALEATFALYGEHRFGFTASRLGIVFAYIGFVLVLVQGGLVGRLSARHGERRVAIAGAAVVAAGLGALPVAPTFALLLVAVGALAAGQGLLTPTLATLLSREVDAADQGGALGAGQSMAAAARAVGPLFAGWLFDVRAFLPYAAASAIMVVALWLVVGVRPRLADAA